MVISSASNKAKSYKRGKTEHFVQKVIASKDKILTK
jgi:hypothetical protein